MTIGDFMNSELLHEILFVLFAFLGGFGMFLYGMNVLAEGLQKSAGEKMKTLLSLLTKNRVIAVGVGALVTMIVQSSSATTVMIVGFVNAGLMNLTQAVGIIMGANIGTTVTAWLVSSQEWAVFLKPNEIAPLAIFIGAMLLFFSKQKRLKQIGEVLVGFGFLFIGLEVMGGAIKPYRDSKVFKDAFVLLGSNPIYGILAGTLVTAIIQSSSASVGILQTLAMEGLIPWNAGVYIILGQNIGTCVTAMLSSIGTSKNAKRAAIIHLLFNVIGTIIFATGSILYFEIINTQIGSLLITSTGISIFHTLFNVASTIVLFPFANIIVRFSERILPGSDELEMTESAVTLRHLDERILETPSFAVENAIKETIHMAELAYDNVIASTNAIINLEQNVANLVKQKEKDINALEQSITKYLVKLFNTNLSENQKLVVTHLFNIVNDIERIGDHALNITELAEYNIKNNVQFSDVALKGIVGHGRVYG
jgi:phosphate:Na+ symporter